MVAKDKFLKIGLLYKLFKEIDKKRENVLPTKEEEIEMGELNDTFIKYIINNTIYKQTTKKIIDKMIKYDFIKTPSVRKRYDIHLKNSISNYDILEKIDLYQHTINVCIEIISLNTPKNITTINILNALLHDFGKNPNIARKYGDLGIRHEKVSANFAQKFLDEMLFEGNREINEKIINTIVETVSMHHSPTTTEKNSFLYYLREADSKARKKEIMFIKEENR